MFLTAQERSGTIIVASTAIGASMLSLPFVTGISGYFYACLSLIGCFAFALLTLLLVLELTLYTKNPEANMSTIAYQHLGIWGKNIAAASNLLILYVVAASYVIVGAEIIAGNTSHILPDVSKNTWEIIFTLSIGFIAFRGVSLLDKINQMIALCGFICYFGLIGVVAPSSKLEYLSGGQLKYFLSSVPITYASYACHFVVPSLRKNFSHNISSLKKMMLYGLIIPLIFYMVYEFLIISILPFDGANGLLAIAQNPSPVKKLLQILSGDGGIILPVFVSLFSICAVLTSFLGVSLALSDFLVDSLELDSNKQSTPWISGALSLIPPLIMALLIPDNSPGFTLALDYSGLLVAFLFGLMPAIMVWKARYIDKEVSSYQLTGGKSMLIIIAIISLGIMINVIANTLKWVPTP